MVFRKCILQEEVHGKVQKHIDQQGMYLSTPTVHHSTSPVSSTTDIEQGPRPVHLETILQHSMDFHDVFRAML